VKKRKMLFKVIIPIVPVLAVVALLLIILSSSPSHYYPSSADSDRLSGSDNIEPVESPEPEEPEITDHSDELDEPEEPDEHDEQDEPDDLNEFEELEEPEEPDEPIPPPEEEIFNIRDFDQATAERLDTVSARYKCVAVSLVVYDGETRDYYTYQFGHRNLANRRPVDQDTKFRVASLAKLVAVIAAMSLVEEELLDLDKDISEYLGYSVRNPKFPDTIITTRMLIQHTSSLHDSSQYLNAGNRNMPSTAKRLLDTGVCYESWEPGTKFEYSNFGYSVLGLVCENVSGKRFNSIAKDAIFKPLEIDAAFLPGTLTERTNIAVIYNSEHTQRRSVSTQLSTGDPSSAGSDHNLIPGNLTLSIIDYTKILTMLAGGGILDDVRILSESSVKEIHDMNSETEWYIQGLSIRYQNNPELPLAGSFWHTGSAFGVFAQFNYYMGDGINRGAVVITTGASTGRLGNGMVEVCTELSEIALQMLS